MRGLIINADGYGLSPGITRAIEECVRFGTVRSISVNVNGRHADRLPGLVHSVPELSVGCHINPVVGYPVLPAARVSTLLNHDGQFFYQDFVNRFVTGRIRLSELHAEIIAQVEKTRELSGRAFSHVDFHMGLHRLPRLYALFLDVAEKIGAGRIRTHSYRVGLEYENPRRCDLRFRLGRPSRVIKLICNHFLRRKALRRGLAMPDRRVEIMAMVSGNEGITVENYLRMLRNLPTGVSEFVAHPGYLDEDLARWSTYLEPRVLEHQVLMSGELRAALHHSDVRLMGYRDIPARPKPVYQFLATAGGQSIFAHRR